MPGTPRLSPLRCRSVTAEWRCSEVPMPNWLLVTMKTTGRLPQRGEVERLAERALVGGAVAERAQRDVLGAFVVGGEREAGGDRQVAADDAVAAHEAARDVEHVHRAAAPAGAAVDAPEQLGHDVLGRRAAHERVTVRAVGGDQVVAVAQRARAADDRRLLADRQMQEAADLGARVHLAGALLEAADQRHRLQPLARDGGLGQALPSIHGTPAREELRRRRAGRAPRAARARGARRRAAADPRTARLRRRRCRRARCGRRARRRRAARARARRA